MILYLDLTLQHAQKPLSPPQPLNPQRRKNAKTLSKLYPSQYNHLDSKRVKMLTAIHAVQILP